jgi:hypothetical protein
VNTDTFRRGPEMVKIRYDSNDKVEHGELYRYGILIDRTDNFETVKRWLSSDRA